MAKPGGYVPACLHLKMGKTQPIQTRMLHEGLARQDADMRPKLLLEGHTYVLDGIFGLVAGENILDFKLLEA